jgi:hypothetical protein
VAVFVPLELFTAMEIIKNRDMSEYIAAIYDTKLALWVWIALIPAMIAGHFAARVAEGSRSRVIQVVGAIFLFWGAGLASFAIHIYTTYLAYQTAGAFAAFVTLGLPPISEVYWFMHIWSATGVFFNLYTLRILALGCLYLIGAALLGIGVKLENAAKERENCGAKRDDEGPLMKTVIDCRRGEREGDARARNC